MSTKVDLTGRIFGRLTVLEDTGERRRGNVVWLCLCECGESRRIVSASLKSGLTKSCGCLHREIMTQVGKDSATHGMRNAPEYRIWASMKDRCLNPRNPQYPEYKDRAPVGDWLLFENFWADMGARPSPQHSLERKNNDLPYSKENCMWATSTEQARNRSSNRLLTYKEVTQCISAWAAVIGMSKTTLLNRLNRGWTAEKALTHPIQEKT